MGRHEGHHRLAGGRHRAAAVDGAACCRCPATAASSGTATCRSPRCRRRRTRPAATSPPPTTTCSRTTTPTTPPGTGPGPIRTAPVASRRCSAPDMRFSVAEVARLQNDDLSLPARALVPLLRDLPFSNPAVAAARDAAAPLGLRARQELGRQPRCSSCSRGSSTPACAQAVMPAAARGVVPGNLVEPQEDHRLDVRPRRPLRRRPDQRPRRAGGRRASRHGVAEATKRFGPDMAAWKWGAREAAPRAHPPPAVQRRERRDEEASSRSGPLPRGGDGTTVSATGGSDNQVSGGSLKIIADTQDWDNTIGAEHARPVGRPRRPALPRPVRAVGRGPLLPGGLLAGEGGIGGRAHHVADTGGGVDLRRAAVNSGLDGGHRRHQHSGRGGGLPPPPHAALGGAHGEAVGRAAGQRRRRRRAQHLPHLRVQHVEAVVVDAAGLEVAAQRRAVRPARRRRRSVRRCRSSR